MELIEVKNTRFEGYQKSEVTIPAKDISLNAAYYLPENAASIKGALIIVHGSAPSEYEDVTYYTRIGTRLQMAVLAFDKRGVGKSGGTYERFTVEGSKAWFDLLASDVLACYSWLRKRPEMRQAKIGLLGGSQAGWIIPLAASREPGITFLIIGEGVAVSAGEESYFSELTGDGDEAGIPIPEADSQMNAFSGEPGFDPATILANLKTPALWFFGTQDPVIPVDASLRELARISNPKFSIRILEGGDHNFRNTKTGESYDLVSYIRPWLQGQGVLP